MGFRKRQSRSGYDLACLTITLAMVGFLGSGLGADGPGSGSKPGPGADADSAAKARLVSAYGKLRLSFEANRGQTQGHVKFLSRGPGYALYLTKDGAVLALSQESEKSKVKGQKAKVEDSGDLTQSAFASPGRSAGAFFPAVLRMKLLEADPRANLVGLDELPGKTNYFIGNDPGKWRTNVPNYGKVKYSGVFPGIDLVYYGNQRQLEYDFVVSPGADPRNIVLQFETRNSKTANRKAEIASNGDLVIHTEGGEVRLRKPVVYQVEDANSGLENRKYLDGRYVLRAANPKSKIQNPKFEVAFEVASYDPTLPLVIDPVMDYSTYLGGSGDDQGFAVAVDGTGNAYITGQTVSTNFPPAGTPFDATCTGCVGSVTDAFVAKVNAAGSALVYTTYLGGSGLDRGNGIKVDGTGNAYVTGFTLSADFPPLSAFDATYNGGGDAFVTKLNSTGSALVYSSYLGGAALDEGLGIALDGTNNAYVTGYTWSTAATFPETGGAFQTVAPSGGAATDAFVAKINAAGSSLGYCTYLGGAASSDQGNAIAVDGAGNAYIAGETKSLNFPTTAGVFDAACGSDGACDGGLATDVFVAKLNTTGTALTYSTFLGGGDNDRALGIALDSTNNAYVTGVTESVDFPTSGSALQPNSAGGFEIFVTKVNPTATALVYSTYLGGNGFDQGNSIAVDTNGNAYVAGATGSTDFPLASPVQTTCASCPASSDALLAKVNATGTALVFSTYLGGIADDTATGVALDGSANAYIAGGTTSTDFPTVGTPIQATNGGGSDAFVAKVSGLALPVASLDKTGLNFGSLAVGFTTAPQVVTLTNRGNALLTITSIIASGDFGETHPTCGATLAASASCTINVTFTPTATGTRDGALTITDDAYGSPQVVNLTGVGTSQAVVGVAPGTLTFGNQRVGTTSATQPVTLTNSGTGTLDIASVTATTDYNVAGSSTCGATVLAGANCTINVSYSPTTSGANAGTLTITGDDAGSPHAVTLSGTGILPVVDLTSTSLTFADQVVGTQSTGQTVTLTNTGNTALTITSITLASADFNIQTNNCPGSLGAGLNCAITVRALPTATGTRLGEVTITDDAPTAGSTHTISLSVNGIAPVAKLFPASLTFAARLVNTTSAGQSFTIQNIGTAPLHITAITAGGDFALTSATPCGAFPVTMAVGAPACTITVTFTPTASGTRVGSVTINDDSGAAVHTDTVNLDGTGTAPVATLATASLTFASRLVGTTSAGQSFAIQNTGTAPLHVTAITVGGDYALTSATPCGAFPATIAVSGSCTVTVTFTPTASGTRLGAVTITDDSGAATHTDTVSLDGVGTAPVATLAPASLTFAARLVNTTSAGQSFAIQNTGTAPLHVTAITVGGDYALTSATPCGAFPATIAVSGSCTVTVTFTPTASGTRLGAVTIDDDSGAAVHVDTVTLDGTGTAPISTLSTSTLSFAGQVVNTTSASQSFTIQNTGTAPLHVAGIAVGGDFALTGATPCGAFPATIAVSGSCTVTVTFTPTASGTRLGSVTITDDSGAATHTATVSLDGSGIAPTSTLSVATLSFGNQLLGTTSAGKSFTITNTGTAPLHIAGISVGGDYALTSATPCGAFPATVAVSASCTVTVTFTPTAAGTRLGTVTINNDSGAAVHVDVVNLDGTGVAPAVSFAPALLDFGTQLVGTTSASKSMILSNSGTSNLTITGIVLPSPDFALTSATPCGPLPATLAPAGTCTLTVTFKPTTTDIRRGGITITDDAGDSPQTLNLSGVGIAPAVTFGPPTLSFANQIVGTLSGPMSATLTNSGTSPLTISGITLVGTDFALSTPTPCGALPATLAIGGTCTFTVTFTPTTTDIRRGGITVTNDAADSPQTLALSGTGTAPGVSLTPPSVSFPDQLVNTTSAPQSVTLQNTGSAPLTITSIVLASTDFALTSATPCGPLPATLAVGATCTFTITFTPTTTDIRRAGITITDNAPGSPHVISLNGVGTAPAVGFAPDSLDFGNQAVGVTSASQTATLKNIGGAPLILSAITLSGDFALTTPNPCGALPATIAPNGTCTFTVTFTPSVPDIRRGAITVFSNASGSPHALSLGGFGATPGVTLTPDLLTFVTQGVGTTSASQTAALKNTGTAPLTITSITVSGDFALTSATPCGAFPATLAAGATCSLPVTFTPTTTDVRHGAVTITDNAIGSPHVVGLSGTGATPFALSTAADTVTISRGVDTATYTINATSTFAFTGDIVLSCTGTESGVCTFSPATIKPGQSSTLTLSGAAGFTGNFLIFSVQGLSGFQAASQPLTLLISDYTVAPTSASVTVTAGQPATYTLNFAAANGFTGTVSLACAGNPVRSTCAIAPTTVTLDGVNPATATVTITTTARAAAPPNPATRFAPPGFGIFDGLRQQMLWLLAFLLLVGIVRANARRLRLNAFVLAAVLMTALLWVACGGETANVPPGDVGTPAGTYNVTITATSGSTVHTTTLTLKVN